MLLVDAHWVRQIFAWFVTGRSPKWIAHELNRQNVPSPRKSTWCSSAIYGDCVAGTGLLCNKLYIGEVIWNRSQWIKDPDIGRRRRFVRPETEWLSKSMPELRIVEQDLWDAAQARLLAIRERSISIRKALDNPKSRSHVGKYLFSGLLKCGCCGANYTMHSTTSYGCAMNLNRGDEICPNRLRIPRAYVEERLLEAIQEQLFTPEAIDLFVKETTELLRQARDEQQPDADAVKRKLAQAEAEEANIMAAIKAGIITASTKAALEQAGLERERLQQELAKQTVISDKLTVMLPQATERYQWLAANLRETMQRDTAQAREHLRTLIGVVMLLPQPEGHLAAGLQRNFEGLISLATGSKLRVKCFADSLASLAGGGEGAGDASFKVCLVAGAGFEPAAFRL